MAELYAAERASSASISMLPVKDIAGQTGPVTVKNGYTHAFP